MKRTLKRCFVGIMLAVLLGASCLLAACGDNETPPGTETAFTIEGVVSSDMGPLSGVAVTLGEESKTTGTAARNSRKSSVLRRERPRGAGAEGAAMAS